MFHRGERGCAYQGEDGDWHSVTVLTGLLDWPPRELIFSTDRREGAPFFYRGGPPCGGRLLAVLRRQADGVLVQLWKDGSVVEVPG